MPSRILCAVSERQIHLEEGNELLRQPATVLAGVLTGHGIFIRIALADHDTAVLLLLFGDVLGKVRAAEEDLLLLRPGQHRLVLECVVVVRHEGDARSNDALRTFAPQGEGADTIHPAGPLLEQCGVPGQIVVDDVLALEVQVDS